MQISMSSQALLEVPDNKLLAAYLHGITNQILALCGSTLSTPELELTFVHSCQVQDGFQRKCLTMRMFLYLTSGRSRDECFTGIAARSIIRSTPVGIYIASTSTNKHTSIINSF